ncbi:MAG: carboxypeptidase regulatory-like domain-containing protein [Pyrinomonadaceae bacterium]|nr:carboxypeptidase regulatory-like domain-containing protein [Pyrinomonadaceae bacterium]
MNAPDPQPGAANKDRHSSLELRLPFKLIPRAVASLLAISTLLLLGTGNSPNTLAQSQTAVKPIPASTPAIAGQKPAKSSLVTGTIKGRVVSTDGQPITNAIIMAQALTATPSGRPTRVDSEGRFVFDDLPPASYLIIGSAPGYIDQSNSDGDWSQGPRYLIGSNVTVIMIKGGVITGLVTNAKGEPTVGIPVYATLQDATPSIASRFLWGNSSETDDRGIYRIYGLLPGQYTVRVGGNGMALQFTPSGFDIDIPTYYPSSTRDTAIPVPVRSGDETSDIDIKYKNVAGHSISGAVLGNIGSNPQNGAITIFLAAAGSKSVLSLGITPSSDSRRAFSFNGIADGEYDLLASYVAGQNEVAVVARKRVTVRGADVTGVELQLAPLASITGTITLDPIKPEDKCDKRRSELTEIVPIAPRDEPKKSGTQERIALFSEGLGSLNEKGEFALRNLEAAKYRLEMKLPTDSWYVRVINVPGAAGRTSQPPTGQPTAKQNLNAWQGVVTVKSGEQLSGVSIMVGQDAAGLQGRVAPEGAAIREGTRVHLVPIEREQANNVLLYSETLVKSDGSFALTNIAPGKYFVLSRVEAVTEVDTSPRPSAWNPIVRAKLRSEAEAANTIVELKPCQRLADYLLKLATPQ